MPPLPRHPRISVDMDTCFGRPRITGTRIRVADILNMMGTGMTEAEILDEYQDLQVDDIRAVLTYAAEGGDHPVIMAAE